MFNGVKKIQKYTFENSKQSTSCANSDISGGSSKTLDFYIVLIII
jgi:hypothetical protein